MTYQPMRGQYDLEVSRLREVVVVQLAPAGGGGGLAGVALGAVAGQTRGGDRGGEGDSLDTGGGQYYEDFQNNQCRF